MSGDARGGTLGFPTANLRTDPALLVPAFGIYAGAAGDHRAAVSIGVNPHYGGAERRIEAFLLDFEGDLYGQRVVVELWERLRDDEAAFTTEADLIDQIARDVAAPPPPGGQPRPPRAFFRRARSRGLRGSLSLLLLARFLLLGFLPWFVLVFFPSSGR